ncbi:MAG: UPF0182 family protein [Candidatus Thorarchaeota archaeon]
MKKSHQILITLVIIAVISVVVLGSVYGWFLGQTIYQTTYSSKAGVDYWATWTLENNIFTASLLLAILSIITLPQRSTFISFMSALSQSGTIIKRLELRSAILWRLLEFGGFFAYYVSTGGYSITGQNVAFLMMLISHGSISMSSQDLGTLFSLPFAPGTSSDSVVSLIPAMETYQLYLGLVSTILVVTAGRIILSLVTDMLMQRRDMFVVVIKVLFVATLVLGVEILTVPMWTVNAGTWMSYLAMIIGMIAAIIAAFIFMAMRLQSGDTQQRLRSKIIQLEEDLARLQGELLSVRQEYETGAVNAEDYRRRVTFLMEDRAHISNELRRLKLERLIPIGGSPRRFGFLAVILIVMVAMLPVIQGLYYGIQMDGDRYLDWKYDYETSKEISITNWAAGLDGMESLNVDQLTSNATPETEVEFLTSVRQWDQEASFLRMKNQIGTNWMQLADSDIVYLNNHEYWIAPLTFDFNTITQSFITQHLIYTHTEGMVVLDAYTGDVIEHDNLVALFNRSEEINTYYGEGRGFGDVAFTNVPSFTEVGNESFEGTPDYTLTGFESTFYMFSMGPEAWSFAGRDMDMLLERDVTSRVRAVMLQGLTVDSDPYIVVSPNGELSYAVSVYIDYQLATSYAHENYMRFMGVVLVDIETGELEFYNPPQEEASFFIDSTYMDYYDWQDAPYWLQSQMKWPEDLYERQLEVAYIFHVSDGIIWKGGNDFHQAPVGSDTRYIIQRIDGVDRFVAMHNSEFLDSAGRNLAGLYVMGCGNKNFGELTFYMAGSGGFSTLLGPNAAVQAFETNDEVRTQLQLWGEHRYGNRLMYHLGGELLFVIPVFLVVETSIDSVIQKLGGVGLVDAETGKRVTLGTNVIEAYYEMFGLLNQTAIEEGEVGFESASFDPMIISSGNPSALSLLMRNNDDIAHNLTLDIVVAAGNFSVLWHGADVLPAVYAANTTFTLNIGSLGAGDTYGTVPFVTAFLPPGLVSAQYLIVLTLRTEEGIVDQMSLILTVT